MLDGAADGVPLPLLLPVARLRRVGSGMPPTIKATITTITVAAVVIAVAIKGGAAMVMAEDEAGEGGARPKTARLVDYRQADKPDLYVAIVTGMMDSRIAYEQQRMFALSDVRMPLMLLELRAV